jgi:hypothetical protein
MERGTRRSLAIFRGSHLDTLFVEIEPNGARMRARGFAASIPPGHSQSTTCEAANIRKFPMAVVNSFLMATDEQTIYP